MVRSGRRRKSRVYGAQRRRQARARTIRWAVRIAAAVVVVSVGGRLLWQAARSRPHFAVQDVQIVGTQTIAAGDLRELAGVTIGTSTWDVDLEAVRQRVLRHPWVANARVRRSLPSALIVTVREHRPVAAIRVGDASYAVDRRGGIFASLTEEASEDLPEISGVPAADLTGKAPSTASELRQTAALIRILSRHRRIVKAHIDESAGVTLHAAALPAVPIHFGWGGWKRKRRRLNRVLEFWSGRESQLEEVNLAFGGQVVVRLRAGVG